MLTRKDTPWNWSDECQEAFQRIKDSVSATPVLAYYDPHKELIVQVDSSLTGLGTVLLQDGKPIEYASHALTSSEVNWAQIELEKGFQKKPIVAFTNSTVFILDFNI